MAAKFATDYGLEPDPWQRLVLDDWLAEAEDGTWASLTCGLSVPRQNGKNGILEVRELYGMVGLGEQILHTAHELPAAQKAFGRLLSFFGVKVNDREADFPELNALVKSFRFVNGQEAIFLKNGGSLQIRARTKKAGRSFTVDVLVADEAQEMSDADQEALLPTTSAAPLRNPQWIFIGTPPGPTANGEVFSRVRLGALVGESRVTWHEWSCESDVDMDSRDAWAQANPGLGIRVLPPVLEAERVAYSDDGFARERLGMWSPAGHAAVIDPRMWAALEDRSPVDARPTVLRPVAFALDVTPDRSKSSVVVSAMRADGFPYVEILANEPGTSWVVEYMAERVANNPPCAVVLDAAGPAGSLIPDFEAAGFTVATPATWKQGGGLQLVVTSSQAMGQACGAFYDAATSRNLRHLGDPRLTTAVDQARKRTLGDAWAWHRRDAGTDISPLVAATLALFGHAKFARVKPKSKAGFGF